MLLLAVLFLGVAYSSTIPAAFQNPFGDRISKFSSYCASLPTDPHCPAFHSICDLLESSNGFLLSRLSSGLAPKDRKELSNLIAQSTKEVLLKPLEYDTGASSWIFAQRLGRHLQTSMPTNEADICTLINDALDVLIADIKHYSIFGRYGCGFSSIIADLTRNVASLTSLHRQTSLRLERIGKLLIDARRTSRGTKHSARSSPDVSNRFIFFSLFFSSILFIAITYYLVKRIRRQHPPQ